MSTPEPERTEPPPAAPTLPPADARAIDPTTPPADDPAEPRSFLESLRRALSAMFL